MKRHLTGLALLLALLTGPMSASAAGSAQCTRVSGTFPRIVVRDQARIERTYTAKLINTEWKLGDSHGLSVIYCPTCTNSRLSGGSLGFSVAKRSLAKPARTTLITRYNPKKHLLNEFIAYDSVSVPENSLKRVQVGPLKGWSWTLLAHKEGKPNQRIIGFSIADGCVQLDVETIAVLDTKVMETSYKKSLLTALQITKRRAEHDLEYQEALRRQRADEAYDRRPVPQPHTNGFDGFLAEMRKLDERAKQNRSNPNEVPKN